MKFKGRNFSCLILLITLIFVTFSNAFPFGFSAQERETVNLQTFVVSDFGDVRDRENAIIWTVKFSRFAKPLDMSVQLSDPDPEACNIEYIEAKPLGLPQNMDASQKWSIGVKAQFIKQSYNWIEIIPGTSSNFMDGNPEDKPDTILQMRNAENTVWGDAYQKSIVLEGVIKSLDVWVWGGNYSYWMEFYLLDYKGFLHRLSAGDLTYIGWRNLRTKIPEYIPQAENRVPFMKPLKLEMIKLWSYPTERVDQFYVYFDYMQVQTDVYIERFNGDDLALNAW